MKIVFALVLVIASLGCAGMQQVREEDKTISQVYETPGFKKDALYEHAKIWIAQTFKSAKAVTEYENKETGTIIGNGIASYPCSGLECIAKSDWTIPFTMKIDVKDDKFRLTFSNLGLAWPSRRDSSGFHPAHEGPLRQQGDYDVIRPVLLKYGEDIKASLAQSSTSDKW